MARVRGSDPVAIGGGEHLVRQFVLLLAAVVLGAVVAPVGAHAAGQLVSIVDSQSDTDMALVDAGRLRVGDGSGALTVDGTVTTVPAVPSQFDDTRTLGTQAVALFAVSSTQRIAINSFSFFSASTSLKVVLEVRDLPGGGPCSPTATLRATRTIALVAPSQTLFMPFPEPLYAPFGVTTPLPWCLYGRTTAGTVSVFIQGRFV
jgi:hypothetical protein